jgi:predicted nucleic acid-binding protein
VIVVADTSPLNYLILTEAIDVLQKLFGALVIPRGVHAELLASRAPEKIRKWAESPPDWVEIRTATHVVDSRLDALDSGEREAIAIFEELGATQLLMDDLPGRKEAARRGIPTVGTLGILKIGADAGLVDLEEMIRRLRRTNFFLTDALIAKLFAEP